MKLIAFAVAGFVAQANAFPSFDGANFKRDDPPVGVFRAAGPSDLRSPCPAFNTLANHGYFPRDGTGVTYKMIVDRFLSVFSLSVEVSSLLAYGALQVPANETENGPGLFGIRGPGGLRPPKSIHERWSAICQSGSVGPHMVE